MQEPSIFHVNFPLTQAQGLFPLFQRSNSFEEYKPTNFLEDFRPIGSNFSLPPDLFGEEETISTSPLLFSTPDSDSDFEPNSRSGSSSPTDELILNGEFVPPPPLVEKSMMEKFPMDKVSDFKHVIYNLLVDHHNQPQSVPFIEPVQLVLDGEVRTGFRFLESYNPDKKLPELYAQHIRRARLDLENQDSIFIQDLYKFYLRAVLELLAKYFEKSDKYTFLDDDAPLFVAGTSIREAEARMKTMRTRARKRKTANRDSKKGSRKNKRDW